MPAKNRIKQYVENSFYHLYNRGVEKRQIFMDEQDYSVFLSYLKTYLLPKDEKQLKDIIADPRKNPKEKGDASDLLVLNNFADELELNSYTTMPNHFHFLVYQTTPNTIDRFMNSLGTRYTMYFNKRYNRVGPLFQGCYKGVLVETDEQLLYMSRYIHRNSWYLPERLRQTIPSSYPVYLGKIHQEWVKPERILSNFAVTGFNSYQSFVESDDNDEEVKAAITIDKLAFDLET